MVVDLATKRHKIMCSFEGLNMQPSISKDGKKVVLCLSRTGNSELYLYDSEVSEQQKRRVFRQITKNGGTNVSPQLLNNGDIIFCSDFKTGSPQVFYLDMANNKIKQLTSGGYCGSPRYCEKNRCVVYTKPVDGTFQLFRVVLDENHSVDSEEQITFNEGDKHTPSWSDCGKYITFSYRVADDDGILTPQIAVLNNSSGKIRVLTQGKEAKSFPTWRNRYA